MKKEETTFSMLIVLFLVCSLSAVGLSFLYVKTKPKIDKNKLEKEIKTKKQIVPLAENFVSKFVNGLQVEICYDKNNNIVGYLLKSSCKGYGGDIEYIISISTTLPIAVKSVKVISHKETPGLGANVTKEKFTTQFIGKTAKEIVLKKDSVEGQIDSITGATITSRAITNSIRMLIQNKNLENFIEKQLQPSLPTQHSKEIQTKQKENIIHISTTTE